MQESKSCALPLGDSPILLDILYGFEPFQKTFTEFAFSLVNLLNMSKGDWRDLNPRIVEPQSTVLAT